VYCYTVNTTLYHEIKRTASKPYISGLSTQYAKRADFYCRIRVPTTAASNEMYYTSSKTTFASNVTGVVHLLPDDDNPVGQTLQWDRDGSEIYSYTHDVTNSITGDDSEDNYIAGHQYYLKHFNTPAGLDGYLQWSANAGVAGGYTPIGGDFFYSGVGDTNYAVYEDVSGVGYLRIYTNGSVDVAWTNVEAIFIPDGIRCPVPPSEITDPPPSGPIDELWPVSGNTNNAGYVAVCPPNTGQMSSREELLISPASWTTNEEGSISLELVPDQVVIRWEFTNGFNHITLPYNATEPPG